MSSLSIVKPGGVEITKGTYSSGSPVCLPVAYSHKTMAIVRAISFTLIFLKGNFLFNIN
jgi:hypothetical protein